MKKKLKCILLIDDADATNFINRKIIERVGIDEHIEIKLNGKEAIDYIIKSDDSENDSPLPSLILLDINMPIMDGWGFLQNYHELETFKKDQIILLMLSTSLNPDDKRRAEAIPEISDYVYKPLTVEVINEVLKKHFPDFL